jgi:hypothetical protein
VSLIRFRFFGFFIAFKLALRHRVLTLSLLCNRRS